MNLIRKTSIIITDVLANNVYKEKYAESLKFPYNYKLANDSEGYYSFKKNTYSRTCRRVFGTFVSDVI